VQIRAQTLVLHVLLAQFRQAVRHFAAIVHLGLILAPTRLDVCHVFLAPTARYLVMCVKIARSASYHMEVLISVKNVLEVL
jgi:hypothetical protein